MMNAMLVSSNAPDNLWGEALLTACHLQNRIPYKKTGKTPYELWKGYKPNLKYLKVWGCLAKVMFPEPKRKKIGSKTFDCMFIGYAKHSAAYRFLVFKSEVLDYNTIIETKNAEFFGHNFPLKSENISENISISLDTQREKSKIHNLRYKRLNKLSVSLGNILPQM